MYFILTDVLTRQRSTLTLSHWPKTSKNQGPVGLNHLIHWPGVNEKNIRRAAHPKSHNLPICLCNAVDLIHHFGEIQ